MSLFGRTTKKYCIDLSHQVDSFSKLTDHKIWWKGSGNRYFYFKLDVKTDDKKIKRREQNRRRHWHTVHRHTITIEMIRSAIKGNNIIKVEKETHLELKRFVEHSVERQVHVSDYIALECIECEY